MVRWNIQHPKGVEQKDKEGDVNVKISKNRNDDQFEYKSRWFLEFREETIDLSIIKTISKSHSISRDGIVYEVIFNKDLSDRFIMCNKVFKFMDERIRDQHYQDLKDQLNDIEGVVFI